MLGRIEVCDIPAILRSGGRRRRGQVDIRREIRSPSFGEIMDGTCSLTVALGGGSEPAWRHNKAQGRGPPFPAPAGGCNGDDRDDRATGLSRDDRDADIDAPSFDGDGEVPDKVRQSRLPSGWLNPSVWSFSVWDPPVQVASLWHSFLKPR